MKCRPDVATLLALEQKSRSHPLEPPWLRAINSNDQCYRWWLWHMCRSYEIETALELGVEQARTTCILATAVKRMVIGIEKDPHWPWIKETVASLPERHKRRLNLVVGDSIDPETVGKVKKLLGVELLELLFIDSHHTADHARAELDAYVPMMAWGGLVIMDDIINHPELRDVLYEIPGDHAELNHLHALGGLSWASNPPSQSGGFGVAILDQRGDR